MIYSTLFSKKVKLILLKCFLIFAIFYIYINNSYSYWKLAFNNNELYFLVEFNLYNLLIILPIIFSKIPLKIMYVLSILSYLFLYLALNTNNIYFEKNFTLLSSIGFYISIFYIYSLSNIFNSNSIDELTGILNLESVLKLGDKYIENGNKLTAYVLDINNFKAINYMYGHLIGNKILIQISQSLKEEFKNYNVIIGRLGGDEFVILINNIDKIHSINITDMLRTKLTNKYFDGDKDLAPIRITFTIGMSHTNYKSIKTQDLLYIADKNMYYNKHYTQGISINKDFEYILNSDFKDLLHILYEKDIYSFVHSQFVVHYAVSLAKYLDFSNQEIQEIGLSSWLHDIGKLIISNEILSRRDKLTNEEYEKVKSHVIAGINILSSYSLSQNIIDGIKYHHERWDRKGYPFGISGEKNPFYARIIQIADSFSAMTIKRVYRYKMSIKEALIEIRKCEGTQFDPVISEQFINMIEKNYL